MVRILIAIAAGLALCTSAAVAELPVGARAPLFAAQASLGGKVFTFDLKRALTQGPVVLYFYPAAFTKGCTLEAHDFAAHIGDYRRLGAVVIGVSEDDIATLQRFSVSACRSRFPVAADANGKIARAYDAVLRTVPRMYANRTSYVIAPGGRIVYAYTSLKFSQHVSNTLHALARLEGRS
ncbi:MAG TPA: peroxiredoxin [Candidatus Acidoferrales bacterium]|nr:peroxiredoxin [Candidatus Acidoferrales bacterium]